jgi:hypothetical protein
MTMTSAQIAASATLSARLWSKVDSSGGSDVCWPYTGHVHSNGYAVIRVGGRGAPRVGVHVAAFLLSGGVLAEGEQVDHVRERGCTLRSCCNPSHLEAVSSLENLIRADSPSSINRGKTHCVQGHDLRVGANVYRWRGRRLCRPCRYAATSRWKKRRAA